MGVCSWCCCSGVEGPVAFEDLRFDFTVVSSDSDSVQNILEISETLTFGFLPEGESTRCFEVVFFFETTFFGAGETGAGEGSRGAGDILGIGEGGSTIGGVSL